MNKKGFDRPNIVTPLDFINTKVIDLLNDDCEHYSMSQKMMKELQCRACILILDYTKICEHKKNDDT